LSYQDAAWRLEFPFVVDACALVDVTLHLCFLTGGQLLPRIHPSTCPVIATLSGSGAAKAFSISPVALAS
jgi:hypothetical protein